MQRNALRLVAEGVAPFKYRVGLFQKCNALCHSALVALGDVQESRNRAFVARVAVAVVKCQLHDGFILANVHVNIGNGDAFAGECLADVFFAVPVEEAVVIGRIILNAGLVIGHIEGGAVEQGGSVVHIAFVIQKRAVFKTHKTDGAELDFAACRRSKVFFRHKAALFTAKRRVERLCRHNAVLTAAVIEVKITFAERVPADGILADRRVKVYHIDHIVVGKGYTKAVS